MNDRPKRDTMSLEEATVPDMREIVVIVEALARLGRIIEIGQRLVKGTTH